MSPTDRVLLCLMWAVSAFLGYALSFALHRHLEVRRIEAQVERARVQAWPRHLETMLGLLRINRPRDREIASAYYDRLVAHTRDALRACDKED